MNKLIINRKDRIVFEKLKKKIVQFYIEFNLISNTIFRLNHNISISLGNIRVDLKNSFYQIVFNKKMFGKTTHSKSFKINRPCVLTVMSIVQKENIQIVAFLQKLS
jgi:hypothetical protein